MAHVADQRHPKALQRQDRASCHDGTTNLPAVDERHGHVVVRSVSVAVHTHIKEPDELQYGTFGGLPVPKHTSTPGLRVMTCTARASFQRWTSATATMASVDYS